MTERSTSEGGLGGPDQGELAALDDLADAIEDNAHDERLLARRVRRLRAGRAGGRTWESLLGREPGLLTLAAQVLSRATTVSKAIRRRVARGLHAEGATVTAIAAMFGVSHQRVSALLRSDASRSGAALDQ